MKRVFLLVFLAFALPAWAQSFTATVTFTDPNTGAQAVDGVRIDRSLDGMVTWTPAITLNPGILVFTEIVSGSPLPCYRGTPFNTAGNGPSATGCATRLAPNGLQNFNVQLK